MNGWREISVGKAFRDAQRAAGAVGTKGYQRECDDWGHLSVLIAREPDHEGELRWHLSISHRTNLPTNEPGRYPTWDEIADARYDLMPDEIVVAMLLPPRSHYVNVHPTTFHLHEIELELGDPPPVPMPRSKR